MRDGFIIHEENIEDIELLTTEEKGQLLEILLSHYRDEKTEESENKAVTLLSRSMCRRMDRDGEVYEKRSNAGSLGGKASKPKAKVSKSKQTVSKNKQTESKPKANLSPVPVPVPEPVPVDINPPIIPPRGEYAEDPALDDAVRRYIDHRKKIRKPITDEGSVKRLLKRLDGMADTVEDKVAIIDQSIDNCWQGLFPLKEPRARPEKHDSKDVLLRIMRGEE